MARLLVPAEQQRIQAGAAAIRARGGPQTEAEHHVCTVADGFPFYTPASEPVTTLPRELAQDHAASIAAVEAAKAHAASLLERVHRTQQRELAAKDEATARQRVDERKLAELAYTNARADLDRVAAAYATVRLKIATFRLNAALDAQKTS